MGNWFTTWLENIGRMRVIPDRDGKGDYIRRYYLIFPQRKEGEDSDFRPFNLFLHNILLSDEDYFHDHPWWYIAIILKGGYYEHTPKGTFWRGPGSIRFSPATGLHHLELPKNSNGKCWTLFFHGPKQRTWGFIDPVSHLWVKHREWLEKRRKQATQKDEANLDADVAEQKELILTWEKEFGEL